MATINVLDSVGATVALEKPLVPGRSAAATSRPVALSTEDFAVLDGIEASLTTIDGRVDGLEALLTTQAGYLDGIETAIASTNTKLDTAITALQIIDNMVLAAGTANIGDVDVLTLPALVAGTANIGDVDVLTLPALVAGTAAIGKVKVTNDAGTVVDPVAAVGGGIPVVSGGYEYETVAASQTAQALGATGATGDYISGILVVPATTSPGVVTLLDNATSISVFVGGASSVSNLVPFFIPLGLLSVSGAWKITTGANVSCIGCGNFT